MITPPICRFDGRDNILGGHLKSAECQHILICITLDGKLPASQISASYSYIKQCVFGGLDKNLMAKIGSLPENEYGWKTISIPNLGRLGQTVNLTRQSFGGHVER